MGLVGCSWLDGGLERGLKWVQPLLHLLIFQKMLNVDMCTYELLTLDIYIF